MLVSAILKWWFYCREIAVAAATIVWWYGIVVSQKNHAIDSFFSLQVSASELIQIWSLFSLSLFSSTDVSQKYITRGEQHKACISKEPKNGWRETFGMFYCLLLDELFWKKPLIAGPINGAKTMSIVRVIIASVKGLSHKKRIDPSYMVSDRLKLSSINPPRMNPSSSGAIG